MVPYTAFAYQENRNSSRYDNDICTRDNPWTSSFQSNLARVNQIIAPDASIWPRSLLTILSI